MQHRAKYWAVTLVAMLLLSACGGGGEAPEDDAGGVGSGSVTIALPAVEVPHLDRQMANSQFDLVYNVVDPVFRLDAEGNFHPGLAESWEFIEDGVLRIKLHENITFSDGEPLNAEGFKVSMDRIMSPESTLGADHFPTLQEVRVVDEFTVDIVHEPDALLMKELAMSAAIFSPKVIAEDPDSLQTNPIGTGPYRVESYSPGTSLHLVARDDYWGQDLFPPPSVREATFFYEAETGVRLSRLRAGEAHLVSDIGHDDAAQLEEGSVVQGLAPEVYYARFGLKDELSSDIRVRRAVTLAIDRERLTQVFAGAAEPSYQIWPSYAVGYAERPTPETDIDEARRLIEEAGATGRTVTLAFSSDYKPGMRDVAQAIAAMIGETGLVVELRDTDGTTFRQDMRDKTAPAFIHLLANGYETLDALTVGDRLECQGAISTFCNPQVDQMFAEARQEQDPEARTQVLQQVWDIVEEEAVVVPLLNPSILAAKSPDLELGEEWTVFSEIRLTELTLNS